MSGHRRCAHRAAIIALSGALAFAAGAEARSTAQTSAYAGTGREAALLAGLAAVRSDLDNRGGSLGGFLQLDGSHVLKGGLPHPLGFDAQRLLDVFVILDTRKLLGWPGGTLFLDAQSHGGPSVIPHQVPAIADPDNMDAYSETSLDRAWFQQDLFERETELPYDPGGTLIVSKEALRSRWSGLPVKLQIGGWVDTDRFRRCRGGVVRHAAGGLPGRERHALAARRRQRSRHWRLPATWSRPGRGGSGTPARRRRRGVDQAPGPHAHTMSSASPTAPASWPRMPASLTASRARSRPIASSTPRTAGPFSRTSNSGAIPAGAIRPTPCSASSALCLPVRCINFVAQALKCL
jgi:hypothetical protein